MLILSRRKDESIIIDGRIEVAIVDIKGDQVKLGIKAPKDVKVFRNEVFLAIWLIVKGFNLPAIANEP